MRGKVEESVIMIIPFNGLIVQKVHSFSEQFIANQIFSDPEFFDNQ